MEKKLSRWIPFFTAVFVLILGASTIPARAGLSFATNTTTLAPNDFLAWTPNNNPSSHPSAVSSNGITVTTSAPVNEFALTVQGFDGFPTNQYAIDNQDERAITFTFSVPLLGFGLLVNNAFGPTYSVTINAFSGANALGGFSVTNTNSSPVFAGVIDSTPVITSVVINSIHTVNNSSNYSYFGNLSLVGPPLLKVSAAATNITVFWPSPSTGFRLQQNTNLSTTNWSNFTGTTNDDGTNKSALIHPAPGEVFFRLIAP